MKFIGFVGFCMLLFVPPLWPVLGILAIGAIVFKLFRVVAR